MILSLIEKKHSKLTPKFQRIAAYIMINYKYIPVLSSAKLAEDVGVSDASVIRFCKRLGFMGFLDFKNKLLLEINENDHNDSPVEKITRIIKQLGENDKEYAQMLQTEVVNLQFTLTSIDIQTLKNTAVTISKARKLFIIGFGCSQGIAQLLDFNFTRGGVDCEVITHGGVYMYERVFKITEQDAVIMANFPRYSIDLDNVLNHIKKTRAKTVVITDDPENKISRMCDHILTSPCHNPLLPFHSYVGPVSICNALLFEYFKQNAEFCEEYLKNYSELSKFYIKN